jgi:hypothetical protein
MSCRPSYLSIVAAMGIVLSARVAQPQSTGESWTSADVGSFDGAGATIRTDGGVVELHAPSPRGDARAARWAYREFEGRFTLQARIPFEKGQVAGLAISDVEPAASRYVSVTRHGSSIRREWRARSAGRVSTVDVPAPVTADGAVWLRLVFEFGQIQTYSSADSVQWEAVGKPLTVTWRRPRVGTLVWSSTDGNGALARFENVALTARASDTRRPFRRELVLPGRIEAEDFDTGREGVAYARMTDEPPPLSEYRSEPVAVMPNADGGYHVGRTSTGDWLEYSVRVGRPGRYQAQLAVASLCCGGRVHVEIDGKDVTGALTVPNTNSDTDEWVQVESAPFALEAGSRRLRLVVDEAGPYCGRSAASIDAIAITTADRSAADNQVTPHGSGNILERVAGSLVVEPRLFEEIRRRSERPDGYSRTLLDAIRRRIDGGDLAPYDQDEDDQERNLSRGLMARDAALLFRILGERHYADKAYALLHDIYTAPADTNATLELGRVEHPSELAYRAVLGAAVALTYDWAKDGWTDAQRNVVRRRITQALDTWPCVSTASLKRPYQAVTTATWRSAELLLMLSVGEQERRADRFAQLKSWLQQHLQNAYGTTGLSPAGLDQTAGAARALIPAALALRQLQDPAIESDFARVPWWRLLMATSSFGAPGNTQLGVDASMGGPRFTTWVSLLLGITPAADHPTYQWFFDRAAGALARPDAMADKRADATAWALMFHSDEAPRVDPNASAPRALFDERLGTAFFRNRWKDADDIVFAVTGDRMPTQRLGRHDVANAFGLSLVAFGHRFIGGSGTWNVPHVFSSLLVDGRAYGHHEDNGSIDRFEPAADGGGYVVLDGGRKYERLGMRSAKRHVLVDFSAVPGSALIVTLDSLTATENHDFTWQLNLGEQRTDDRLVAAPMVQSGAAGFRVQSENKAQLSGVAAGPGDVRIVADDPIQIVTSGRSVDLIVAMVVGRGQAPTYQVTGEGLDAEIRVGTSRIRFDRERRRLVVARSDAGAATRTSMQSGGK